MSDQTPAARSHHYRAHLTPGQKSYTRVAGDVPLFVEHCEAVGAEADVTRRRLDEQGRRGLSFSFDVLPERHGVPEVACEPSVGGSLLLLLA